MPTWVPSRLMPIVLAVLGPSPAPAAVPEDEPDLKAVRAAQETWWAGLKTLSFLEISYVTDPAGGRDLAKSSEAVEFALAPGDRFAYECRTIRPEQPDRVDLQARWDGKTIFDFHRIADKTLAKPDFIFATPQLRADASRDGEARSNAVRLILPTNPAGSAFIVPGRRGAKLAIERDAEDRPVVLLLDGAGLERWELDPTHDWLPVRHHTGRYFTTTVTKFARRGGLWFPVEGAFRYAEPGVVGITRKFEVKELKINEPIPDAAFTVGDYPGVPVHREDARGGPVR